MFNNEDNVGESLSLTTAMYSNGDPVKYNNGKLEGVYFNQELTLHSYCNSASFNLVGAAITPSLLRELANQLESEILKAANEKVVV